MLRAYEGVLLFRERRRSELALERVADLAGEGMWALRALYGRSTSGPIPAQREAHASNLRVLLGCLEDVCAEVEGFSGVGG